MRSNGLLSKFLIWRVKHLSDKQLVIALSFIVGIATGLAAVSLKFTTHAIRDLVTSDWGFSYLYLAMPLVGILLTVCFVVFLNRGKLGHGLSHILYNISRKSSYIEPDKTYSHMFTSALTVGFGGSAGLEAPIVITGSAIGSRFAALLHLGYKKRTVLIGCGTAAAISAIFNAPIAGVLFTIEVLLLELTVPNFIPILIAAITGNVVSKLLIGEEILFQYTSSDAFMQSQIPAYIALGILTGVLAVYFARITSKVEDVFSGLRSRWSKALSGGALLGVLIFIFPALYGEGFKAINQLLSGEYYKIVSESVFFEFMGTEYMILIFMAIIVLFKVIATNLTLAGGGNGGYFAPSLFMGAMIGFIFARGMNMFFGLELPEASFTLVGMAGMMTGVLHAPLTGIFMIAEISHGYEFMIPLMIVSVLSYATTRYFEPHSLYTRKLIQKGDLFTHDKDKKILVNMELKRVIERDLKTITPETTLGQLVDVVSHSKRNIFPVVDEDNVLRGIILLDDIRHIMFKPEQYEETTAEKLMHSPPAIVSPNEEMDSVMKKFQSTGAWNLPVVDDNKYVGFLSKSKIFGIYRTMLIKQTKED